MSPLRRNATCINARYRRREAEGAEDFLVGAERVDQFELLYQHEDEVFGDLDINDGENADYTWFDEDHGSF